MPTSATSPRHQPLSLRTKLLGLVRFCIISLYTCACFGFIGTCSFLLKDWLHRRTFRKICAFAQQSWFDLVYVLLLDDTKLRVFGKVVGHDTTDVRPRVVVCNHVTDVDWLYLCLLIQKFAVSQTGHVKVILKEDIKKIRVFGDTIDRLEHIWMKRDWQADKENLNALTHKLAQDGEPLWFLIFPEGTTINQKSLLKSQEFARVEHRPDLELTLLPRVRGVEALLNALEDYDAQVLDITMTFESFSGEIPTWQMQYEREIDNRVPNMKKVLIGEGGDCFMDIEEFSLRDLKKDGNPSIQEWLDKRWQRKDRLLSEFASNGTFPGVQPPKLITRSAAFPLRAVAVIVFDYAVLRLVWIILHRLFYKIKERVKVWGGGVGMSR